MRSKLSVLRGGKLRFSAGLMISISVPVYAVTITNESDFSAYRPIPQEQLLADGTAALPKVKQILDDSLNDYSKARIKNLRAVWHLEGMTMSTKKNNVGMEGGTPTLVICMDLNGPNEMGGMTGWHHAKVNPATGEFKEGLFSGCPQESATEPYEKADLPADAIAPAASAASE
jgi:hypothetical protein